MPSAGTATLSVVKTDERKATRARELRATYQDDGSASIQEYGGFDRPEWLG
jgi:hypothetical protein